MARFTQDVVLNKPDDFVFFMMNDFLQKNGYAMSDWKGEPAYRAGDGFVEAYKYLKWSYNGGVFHLEAWMKGSFGGEWDLDGFVGCLVKKPYKESLMQLIALLQQTIPQPTYTQGNAASTETASVTNNTSTQGDATAGTSATNTVPNPNPAPIPVKTVDNHKAAQQALIFGILSLVLCWSPIFCIIMVALAFTRARMGQGSSKASLAKSGKICAIVALCLMIIFFVVNLLLNMLVIFMS